MGAYCVLPTLDDRNYIFARLVDVLRRIPVADVVDALRHIDRCISVAEYGSTVEYRVCSDPLPPNAESLRVGVALTPTYAITLVNVRKDGYLRAQRLALSGGWKPLLDISAKLRSTRDNSIYSIYVDGYEPGLLTGRAKNGVITVHLDEIGDFLDIIVVDGNIYIGVKWERIAR